MVLQQRKATPASGLGQARSAFTLARPPAAAVPCAASTRPSNADTTRRETPSTVSVVSSSLAGDPWPA